MAVDANTPPVVPGGVPVATEIPAQLTPVQAEATQMNSLMPPGVTIGPDGVVTLAQAGGGGRGYSPYYSDREGGDGYRPIPAPPPPETEDGPTSDKTVPGLRQQENDYWTKDEGRRGFYQRFWNHLKPAPKDFQPYRDDEPQAPPPGDGGTLNQPLPEGAPAFASLSANVEGLGGQSQPVQLAQSHGGYMNEDEAREANEAYKRQMERDNQHWQDPRVQEGMRRYWNNQRPAPPKKPRDNFRRRKPDGLVEHERDDGNGVTANGAPLLSASVEGLGGPDQPVQLAATFICERCDEPAPKDNVQTSPGKNGQEPLQQDDRDPDSDPNAPTSQYQNGEVCAGGFSLAGIATGHHSCVTANEVTANCGSFVEDLEA